MAKKKVSHSHQEKPSQNQQDFVKPHQHVTPVMDSEASEKIDSLKSLNQMLLKEAVERRQKVDLLLQSKRNLESELSRSNSEKAALRSELTHLGEMAVRVGLEKSVVAVFVAAQMDRNAEVVEDKIEGLEREVTELKGLIDGKECEIGMLSGKMIDIEGVLGNERKVSRRVSEERDGLKDMLDLLVLESKGLRTNLSELEERNTEMKREISELRAEYDGVVVEKEEKERRIESMIREKDSLERGLVEFNNLMSEIKEELCRVLKEKERFEVEKNAEMGKRLELEKLVSSLNETVAVLQNEAEGLRVNLAKFENECVEGEEKQKVMQMEIDRLVEEKKLSEKRVEGLIDDKNVVEKNLVKTMNQLDGELRNIEDLVNEKNVLLEARVKLDNEVITLQVRADELKAVISKLEESGRAKEERILSLESAVEDYMRKLEQVEGERDEIRNCLDEEKQNVVKLKEQMENMEKKIEEILKKSAEDNAENGALLAKKIEIEGHCESLKKEIASLEKAQDEAQNEISSMKEKVETSETKSELVLNMLKDAAAFCSTDEIFTVKQINGEETKPCAVEFEIIKNAFKSKEAKIDSMKMQLELLLSSVKEAHKKKSFWTVLSSATTIMAAVSLAYAARGTGR